MGVREGSSILYSDGDLIAVRGSDAKVFGITAGYGTWGYLTFTQYWPGKPSTPKYQTPLAESQRLRGALPILLSLGGSDLILSTFFLLPSSTRNTPRFRERQKAASRGSLSTRTLLVDLYKSGFPRKPITQTLPYTSISSQPSIGPKEIRVRKIRTLQGERGMWSLTIMLHPDAINNNNGALFQVRVNARSNICPATCGGVCPSCC